MPYGESGKPGASTSGQSSHDRGGKQHQATASRHERRTTHHPGGDGGAYKPTHVKPGLGPEPTKSKSLLDYSPTFQVGKSIYKGFKNIFQNKATYEKTEHRGLRQNLETGAYEHHAPTHTPVGGVGGKDGDGMAQGATPTQSLVTAPTADKGAGFGHQWNFQAYGNQTQTAGNPYDYTKAPYAKKGKMIRKYATGQEIKNFSKGKRFGPPPLKGPDPQGLQVILENSDYFKKLIG
jgi:hypothetical protein